MLAIQKVDNVTAIPTLRESPVTNVSSSTGRLPVVRVANPATVTHKVLLVRNVTNLMVSANVLVVLEVDNVMNV